MAATREIKAVSREIVRRFHPQRIILFGSHAWGKPTEDSDVDLLVILPFSGRAADESAEIRASLRIPFALDVIARTPEMVEKRLAIGDMFIQDILENGTVLYETDDR